MTLLLIEGWDHLTAGEVAQKNAWTISGAAPVMQTGRFSGQALSTVSSGSGNGLVTSKSLTGSATMVCGFAFKVNQFVSDVSDFFIVMSAGSLACRLYMSGSKINVRNAGGTNVASGTTTIITGNWYYVEVKAHQAGASGTVEVHLNGAAEIASTTANVGSTNFDQIRLSCDSSQFSTAYFFDDMYALNTSGSTNLDFLGDVRVSTQFPTADGAHLQWQATGGGAHWTQVDETLPDSDTTYVSDANPGDLDTYAVADVDGGASVFGVQTNLYARKDDANTRQIAALARQGGTDYVGTTQTLGSSYAFLSQLYDQDPTGSNWTAANYNADEFGVKEIA